MTAAETRAALRDATLAGDLAGIEALLGDDPILRSPVVRFPFQGREAVTDVYRAVLDAFEDFELVSELGEEHGPQVLRFRARVLGREAHTVAMIDTDADGRVQEVTIFVRPLATVAAVGAAMGPRLARHKGPVHVLAARLLTRWLPPVIEVADPILPRLIRFRSG
jgi:hypothetical protein